MHLLNSGINSTLSEDVLGLCAPPSRIIHATVARVREVCLRCANDPDVVRTAIKYALSVALMEGTVKV
jgi:hypothetical protein